MSKPARLSISPGLSMLLDLTRIALSLVVATGHWTQPFFQDTWPDLARYGVMAVGGFFVLSGFTIRMLYPDREHFSFSKYVTERWSRILSVTIPALLLTAGLDTLSWHADPAYYIGNWPGILDHPVRRLLVNLLGVSQVWGQDVAPLSNNPFWSISYELGFYLIYGLWLSGRRLWAGASLLLLGPQVALLLPVWLLGALVYDVCCANAPARPFQRRAWLAVVLAPLGLLAAGAVVVCGARARTVFIHATGIDLNRVSLTLVATAFVFFAVFLVVVLLSARLTLPAAAKPQAIARRLGNLTFPLYLFHFPLFVFLGALHLYDRHSTLQRVLAFLLALALIACVAPVTDYLKIRLRSALTWVFARAERRAPQPRSLPLESP
jgi:peptidoglycan/LPS O-acetylase OafA/YrhL